MFRPGLPATHSQGIGPRRRGHWRKSRGMRIVTLHAFKPFHPAIFGIPISIAPAVDAVEPVTVNRSVALVTQYLRLVVGDWITFVIRVRFPVRTVVAVKASVVNTMFAFDVLMLGKRPVGFRGRRKQIVAFAAPVGHTGQGYFWPERDLANGRAICRRCRDSGWHEHRIGIGPYISRQDGRHNHENGGNGRSAPMPLRLWFCPGSPSNFAHTLSPYVNETINRFAPFTYPSGQCQPTFSGLRMVSGIEGGLRPRTPTVIMTS